MIKLMIRSKPIAYASFKTKRYEIELELETELKPLHEIENAEKSILIIIQETETVKRVKRTRS